MIHFAWHKLAAFWPLQVVARLATDFAGLGARHSLGAQNDSSCIGETSPGSQILLCATEPLFILI